MCNPKAQLQIFCIILILFLQINLLNAATVQITFKADKTIKDAPAFFDLAKNLKPDSTGYLQMQPVGGGKKILATYDKGTAKYACVIPGLLEAGNARSYIVTTDDTMMIKMMPTLKENNKGITFLAAGNKILQYQHNINPAPKGQSKLYERSGFIHPVWSPSGAVLTRARPADHYHHVGIWAPYTKVEFEGRTFDCWNLKKGEGTVRFAKILSQHEGQVFTDLKVLQEHVDFKAPEGKKVFLNEELQLRSWNVSDGVYLIDYKSKQTCATNSPVILKKYRYAGFSIRGRKEWGNENSDYLTSEGKTRKDAEGTRCRWINVSGDIGNDNTAGILFLSSPENPTHPESMRVWPVNSNKGKNNVFLNFNPAKFNDTTIEPGKEFVHHYRMLIHEKSISAEEAEQYWNALAHPPKTTVTLIKE